MKAKEVRLMKLALSFKEFFFYAWSRLVEELGHRQVHNITKGTAGERGNANSRVEGESRWRWANMGHR